MQLRSTKNNTRPPWWIGELKAAAAKSIRGVSEARDETSLPPSPLYNLALAEDLALLPCHSLVRKFLLTFPAAAQVILLLKVVP